MSLKSDPNFTSSGKSENLHFGVLLFSIAYKVSAKKVEKSYFSYHWRVIQTLKKNSLFVWKMTWIIWWILTWTVENLKICTLMGYFWQKYVMFELKKYRQAVSWKMTYGFKNDISNLLNFHTGIYPSSFTYVRFWAKIEFLNVVKCRWRPWGTLSS